MKPDIESLENQTSNLSYERPNLRKHGTMKDLTRTIQGSGGDNLGRMGSDDQNKAPDSGVNRDKGEERDRAVFDMGGDIANDTLGD